MNKKISIIIISIASFILFSILSTTIFAVILLHSNDKGEDAKYLDIEYVGDDGWACLSFYENGEYSMYDCDSEPTSYAFDSENGCKYKYYKNKQQIVFKCKYNDWLNNTIKIKIKKWTKDEIVFEYKGETKKFIREEDE